MQWGFCFAGRRTKHNINSYLFTIKFQLRFMEICELRKSEETCGKVGTTVPSHMYLAVRKRDDKVVGVIDLRHHIDHPILGMWGGHCGYSVRPSERGKVMVEFMRIR